LQPWAACTTLVSEWPSACRRMAPRPYSFSMRRISAAMRSVASSQEMRTYLLMPRFWGLRSPFGSQSTRLRGYMVRLGELTRFLYPRVKGGMSVFILASKTFPRASIRHGFTSYFQSKWNGRILSILPSFKSTWTQFASIPTPRKDSPLTTVLSFSPMDQPTFRAHPGVSRCRWSQRATGRQRPAELHL